VGAGSYDNALAENLWMLIQAECIRGRTFTTRAEANLALFEYIDGPRCPIAYAARSRAARCDVRVGASGCPVH